MDRRNFIKLFASPALGWITGLLPWRRPASAQQMIVSPWNLRHVGPGDEDQLLALMESCVGTIDSFHGLCSPLEWTRTWAEGVITDRPQSILITFNETIVAYFDMPSRTPKIFGDESIDHFQRAFWCGAAGVRMDLLGEEQSVQVFQHLLYKAFLDAIDLGYEFVRAAAPWDRHPYLAKPFSAYPGLTSEPFVDEQGTTKFLLEWRLVSAIRALSDEGADRDLGGS